MNRKDAGELASFVKYVVEEELKRMLPQMLSEMYIKRVVSEGSNLHTQSGTERDEDATPIQEPQDEEGIYSDDSKLMRQKSESVVRKLIGKNSALAEAFAGTEPLPSMTATPEGKTIDVKLMGEAMNIDFSRQAEIARALEKKTSAARPVIDAATKMKELEERRKLLEVKA